MRKILLGCVLVGGYAAFGDGRDEAPPPKPVVYGPDVAAVLPDGTVVSIPRPYWDFMPADARAAYTPLPP